MTEKKLYTPSEAVDYLNEKLKPERPIDVVRLAYLRRERRIHGERVGTTNTYLYTRRALDILTLADIRDKRKTGVDKS